MPAWLSHASAFFRFTEIALAAGDNVVELDYSVAVGACWANHGPHPRLHVVQCEIYQFPFAPESFDFVYCLGMLQHTPDVRHAFTALPAQVKPGCRLAVDLYPKLWRNLLWSKYWLRPLTSRLEPERFFGLVRKGAPRILPLSDAVRRILRIGPKLSYVLPVANYRGVYPLLHRHLEEGSELDTFDMLSSRYDQPQTPDTLSRWLREEGLEDRSVERVGFLVGRGRTPAA